MIQVLYGDEPYGIEVKKKKALSLVNVPQMNYEVRQGSFDLDCLTSCNTFPFLDEKKVVVLDIETLKSLDTKEFYEYLKAPSASTELLVICRNVDKRLKVFKKLEQAGVLCPCEKLTDEKQIRNVILHEVKTRGGNITELALAEFLKRLNYPKEGVNLLLATGFIETLVNINPDITHEAVMQYVPSNEEANEFWLTSLIKNKDADGLLKQISLIPNEDDIKVLSLLLKDYRVAYKLKYFSEKEIGTARTEFADYSSSQLLEAMNTIVDGIYAIKTGGTPKEYALKSVCSKLLTI